MICAVTAGNSQQQESDGDTGREIKKKQPDNEILKFRVIGVGVLELRKYYNIQIECKNKYDTFQVQHLIATVQIAIKASL